MGLVENDMDTLHEEIEHLVRHLVGNDVDILHEERIYLMGFIFIRVLRSVLVYCYGITNILYLKHMNRTIK